MHAHRAAIVSGLASFLLLPTLASADPGAVVWSGGTVELADEHPQVELAAELLVIEPLYGTTEITAELTFHNAGPACTADMGFPVVARGGPGYHFVENFVVDVDGQTCPARTGEGASVAFGEASWYYFGVPFEADQTRQVRVRYDQHSHHYSDSYLNVPYVLATGATWRGALRDLTVEVRLGDRANYHQVTLKAGNARLPAWTEGDSFVWRVADYNGDPKEITLSASRGPARVMRDGSPQGYSDDDLRWRRGKLLMETSLLGDLTLAQEIRPSGGWATFHRGDSKVVVPIWRLPGVDYESKRSVGFVDPEPVFAAFGGSATVGTDVHGDATVEITSAPATADVARETTLAGKQKPSYRIRCLEALSSRWPAELDGVCAEIAGRSYECPEVLMWIGGWYADAPPDFARASSLARHLGGVGGSAPGLAEIVLASADDRVLRGGALILQAVDANAAEEELIVRISQTGNWMAGVGRARNAGLALRVMGRPAVRDRLIAGIRAYGDGQRAKDAMFALAFLGDDQAIPFLMAMADDPQAPEGLRSAAAHALSFVGTPAALEACAQQAISAGYALPLSHALWALGIVADDGMSWHQETPYDPDPAPDWGRPMPTEEVLRQALPEIERLSPYADATGESFRPQIGIMRRRLAGG